MFDFGMQKFEFLMIPRDSWDFILLSFIESYGTKISSNLKVALNLGNLFSNFLHRRLKNGHFDQCP